MGIFSRSRYGRIFDRDGIGLRGRPVNLASGRA
jgi:hypothetical protein